MEDDTRGEGALRGRVGGRMGGERAYIGGEGGAAFANPVPSFNGYHADHEGEVIRGGRHGDELSDSVAQGIALEGWRGGGLGGGLGRGLRG